MHYIFTAIALLAISTNAFAVRQSANQVAPTTNCKQFTIEAVGTATETNLLGVEAEAIYVTQRDTTRLSGSSGPAYDSVSCVSSDSQVECVVPSGYEISASEPVTVKYCRQALVGSIFESYAKRDEANTFQGTQTFQGPLRSEAEYPSTSLGNIPTRHLLTDTLILYNDSDQAAGVGSSLILGAKKGAGPSTNAVLPKITGQSLNNSDFQSEMIFTATNNVGTSQVAAKATSQGEFEVKAPTDGDCGVGNLCTGKNTGMTGAIIASCGTGGGTVAQIKADQYGSHTVVSFIITGLSTSGCTVGARNDLVVNLDGVPNQVNSSKLLGSCWKNNSPAIAAITSNSSGSDELRISWDIESAGSNQILDCFYHVFN